MKTLLAVIVFLSASAVNANFQCNGGGNGVSIAIEESSVWGSRMYIETSQTDAYREAIIDIDKNQGSFEVDGFQLPYQKTTYTTEEGTVLKTMKYGSQISGRLEHDGNTYDLYLCYTIHNERD